MHAIGASIAPMSAQSAATSRVGVQMPRMIMRHRGAITLPIVRGNKMLHRPTPGGSAVSQANPAWH
jgi:hypothetical protein